jgi:hypothetical protein
MARDQLALLVVHRLLQGPVDRSASRADPRSSSSEVSGAGLLGSTREHVTARRDLNIDEASR